MKITIHRGTHQIGGCVTEYESNGWHLFVDYGEGLPGTKKSEPMKVEGLTHGDLSKSALLITHYHGDHIGCITELPKELPIYMGKVGCELQMVLSDHLKSKDDKQKQLLERLQQMNTFGPGKDFTFGPFKIVPVTIDHSAFDAYAFKIEANEVSVFIQETSVPTASVVKYFQMSLKSISAEWIMWCARERTSYAPMPPV